MQGRRESTGSQEGGTEAQQPGAEGKTSRCSRTVARTTGPQLPACPVGYAESSWLGAVALLPSSANGKSFSMGTFDASTPLNSVKRLLEAEGTVLLGPNVSSIPASP